MFQAGKAVEFPYILQKKGNTVDIQQKRGFDYLDSYNNYMPYNVWPLHTSFVETKQKNFNQQLTDFGVAGLHLDVHEGFNFKKENEVSGENMLQKREHSVLTKDIIEEVKKLYEAEDLQDQIACCASIAEKTFRLLKVMDKPEEGNYKKDMVHLFYQVVKRNYAKRKFNGEQIGLLLEMIEKSKMPYIGEEDYFELDERIYQHKFNIFPEGE